MEFGHLLDYNQYITAVFKSQVFLRGNLTKKKTVRARTTEKEKSKEQRNQPLSLVYQGVGSLSIVAKKKRALAVLTEKAMANETKEGMSLHDEYIKLAETCQGLQGL